LMTLMREHSAPPFSPRDHELLRQLVPHLQRAVHLYQRVVDLQFSAATARAALDMWPRGVIVLDDEGRTLLTNRAAEEIVRRGDGLTMGLDGRLRGTQADGSARLGAAIHAARRTASKQRARESDVVLLARRQSLNPLQVFVAPLSDHRTILPDPRGSTVLFITDPDAKAETDEPLMMRLYRFTAAEARLAALLIRGADVKTCADRLGVTQHTVRTHLKRILEKTNSRRQSEFLRVVMNGPLMVRQR
jgi:DNA-binding CsgD family transcriptional regulator